MTKLSTFNFGIALLLASSCSTSGSDNPGSGGTAPTAGSSSAGTGGKSTGLAGSGGSPVGTAGAPAAGAAPMAGSAGLVTGGSGGSAGTITAAGSGSGGKAGSGTGGAAGSATGGSAGSSGASTTGPVTVLLGSERQPIDGFGLNTALSSPSVPWDTFYSTTGAGLGLSIVRVAMTAQGTLSGVVPPASYKAKVVGSPWTAPANCKDNNNTQKGGHLLASCYESWSTTIANFAKNQGLYAMGAANEPDFASCGSTIGPPCNGDYDTMVFTAAEMVAWVKVLGPKLKALNPPVKFIAPEPSEWIHLWSNMSATGSTVAAHPNSSDPLKCGCFGNTPGTTGCATACTTDGKGYDYGHYLAKDATAWGLIDIIGTHEYDTQKAEAWPADVDGGKRSKPIWQTEVSGVMYWPEQGPSRDIKNGLAVAGWIHSALTVGEASGWLYWWYEASGDNEGLMEKGKSELTKRAYTLGNYSKFVRPGATRVDIGGAVPMGLLLSAYKNSDGTVAVVAINPGTTAASLPITISGGTALPTMMTPYVTSATDSLTAKTAIAVTGGTFTAALDAQSVTTFVGK